MQEKFDTKYSFVENEKQILDFWKENDCFKKLKAKNENGPKYRFIDGPITANNPMGIHHVWGRTLKDTYIKYHAMKGCDTHYRNGFDSQGLWVEVEVEKELGFKTKHDIEAYGLDKFTDKCIERVKKFSSVITDQSIRLGQWMDWDNSYFTYTDENITGIWAFLKKCHEGGWIRQVYKPMPWCSRCGTSLSEHEMTGSYKEIEHEAVFFKLPIVGTEDYILVWTTTPWTLSANVALAVNPEMTYVRLRVEGEAYNYITSENYFKQKFAGKEGVTLLGTMKGTDLEGLEYETCFPEMAEQNFTHKIVLWDEVADDEGCGVVHIAPGCGAEDFALGESLGLPKIIPVDEYGIFYDGFGFLSGVDAQESRQMVFDELKNRGKLFYTHKYKHSYPVCWRCKKEIIFRLGKEWAIAVDELRPKLIENANKVRWEPAYQGKRMLDWLENMSDWNISRKRFYGLPLPFYVCPDCGKLTVIGSKEELYEKAVDKSKVDAIPHLHRPWIDAVKIKCDCGAEVERVSQVGDVWLDAGIVPFSTLKHFTDKEYWKQYFPAEHVLEMKEQIRLWFYSLLFMSTVLVGEPPYERVSTHGVVVSEDGSKFSKTGFMIRFDEAADVIGADASRYIFASSSTSNDVRFGFNLGDEAKRKLLAFWNLETFFATYADIDNVKVDLASLDVSKLSDIDRWLVIRTNRFITDANKYMGDYSTRDVVVAFESFVNDISNFYIRVNRSRFWSTECNEDKMNAYSVLFYAIKSITGIIAPMVPFITETTWQRFVKRYSDESAVSVFLSEYPTVLPQLDITDEKILADVEKARDMISLGLKLRNEKQIKIRQPLSTLYVSANEANHSAIDTFGSVIKSELNVGEICELEDAASLESNFLTVNFKVAGRVLKNRANDVKAYLAELDADAQQALSNKVKNGEALTFEALGLEAVEAEVFTLNSKPRDNVAIYANNGEFTALDTTISEELQRAGILRDIVRQCQVFRKSAGFDVSDRIYIGFKTESEYIAGIIEEKKEQLCRDLLASFNAPTAVEYTGSIDLDGIIITVELQRQ